MLRYSIFKAVSAMRTIEEIVMKRYHGQDTRKSYEEAVRALNTLQSNAATISKTKLSRDQNRHKYLEVMTKYLSRSGITMDDVDQLSVIHVTGTKGKGSTCAFCESILRHHGYKTGFFSSPHLVEVRERIRINGKPIAKDAFSAYFWDCYNKLEATKTADDESMPPYFRFLTIMAFYAFLQEKVDVAIIEVGIGGQYDCTNVLRSPVACGVASLGIDHTNILGDTIEQIAWNKGGIFKKGVPAVSVEQPTEGMQVLISRAIEIQNPLYVIPPLEDYDCDIDEIKLGIAGNVQKLNASLALQLCNIWLKDHHKEYDERKAIYHDSCCSGKQSVVQGPVFSLSQNSLNGLKSCKWPGRTQTIKKDNCTYYIDGAHTTKSLQQCAGWFKKVADEEKHKFNNNTLRFLLFNTTGERNSKNLLQELVNCDFDYAVFCPNLAYKSADIADQSNYNYSQGYMESRTILNRDTWIQILYNKCNGTDVYDEMSIADSGELVVLNPKNLNLDEFSSKAHNCDSVESALTWISEKQKSCLDNPISSLALDTQIHIQILCTGSLHLVGAFLNSIDPEMHHV